MNGGRGLKQDASWHLVSLIRPQVTARCGFDTRVHLRQLACDRLRKERVSAGIRSHTLTCRMMHDAACARCATREVHRAIINRLYADAEFSRLLLLNADHMDDPISEESALPERVRAQLSRCWLLLSSPPCSERGCGAGSGNTTWTNRPCTCTPDGPFLAS
jgi:hypothetical protein